MRGGPSGGEHDIDSLRQKTSVLEKSPLSFQAANHRVAVSWLYSTPDGGKCWERSRGDRGSYLGLSHNSCNSRLSVPDVPLYELCDCHNVPITMIMVRQPVRHREGYM